MGSQPKPPYAFGQLFSRDTQAIFYNFKLNPIQVHCPTRQPLNLYRLLGLIAGAGIRLQRTQQSDYL